MKNIFRMAMVAFAAIALSACEPSGGEQGGRGLILDVKVENITATSATVKVSHNGKAADSWYGLLTTNTSTREDMLIEETVNVLKSGDLASQLIFSKNYSKILSSLQPNTTYKYIAFGLTEDGVVYGESASVEFTTQSGNGGGNQGGDQGGNEEVYDNMIVNPNWSVAYTGAGVIGENSYNHTVTVNSADNNYYTIAVVSASDFSAENLRVSAEQLAADIQLVFDEKPSEEQRRTLKRNGFVWSPTNEAWQRQLNANAIRAANYIDFIKPLDGKRPTELQPKREPRDKGREER